MAGEGGGGEVGPSMLAYRDWDAADAESSPGVTDNGQADDADGVDEAETLELGN